MIVDAGSPAVDVPLVCAAGFADCNNSSADGCETNTRFDALNCGACGTVCPSRSNASGACIAGRCDLVCANGFADCNSNPADGCETNTRTSLSSCGACGNTCASRANASASCTNSACAYVCAAGFADCNGNPADGCEVDTRNTEANCGACGHACGTGQICANGACQFTCNPGGDGGIALTSCVGGATCIDLQTDLANCGSCGHVCNANTAAHATCAAGHCGNACNLGFADCDHLVANGCEREVYSDIANCGACGNVCQPARNASPFCSYGWCSYTCNVGFDDCNYDSVDGCETDLHADASNCGTCGNRCPTGQSCSNGACVGPIAPTCRTGQTDCGWPGNSICVNLANDRMNCGSCGWTCFSSEVCSGGCQSCPFGQQACNNACTDLQTNTSNCGVCGHACASTQTCIAGACVTPCAAGQTQCGSTCVNTQGDFANCGACGHACAAGQSCSFGSCVSPTPQDAGMPSLDAGSPQDASTDAGFPADIVIAPVTCAPGYSPRTIAYTIPPVMPLACNGSAYPGVWGSFVGEPIGVAADVVVQPVGSRGTVPLYQSPGDHTLTFTNTAFWTSGNFLDLTARCGDGTYYDSLGYWLSFTDLAAAGGHLVVNGVDVASQVVRVGNHLRYTLGPECVPTP